MKVVLRLYLSCIALSAALMGGVRANAANIAAEVVKLSEPFTEYHAANGGRTLVFLQPKAKQLAVYNTLSGKLQGTIRLGADNVRFACGADVIVVALPDQRILQAYNLKTLKRTKSAPLPDTRPLKDIKMGSASFGPALVCFPGKMKAVNVVDLAQMKLRGALPAGPADSRWFDYRVSADGSTVLAWDTGSNPSNFTITRIKGDVASTVGSNAGFSMANRRFTPSADGSIVLYEGQIFNSAAAALDSNFKETNCLPTADPRFILAVKAGDQKSDVAICTTLDRRILVELRGVSNIGRTDGFDLGRMGLLQDMAGAGEPRAVFVAKPDAGFDRNLGENAVTVATLEEAVELIGQRYSLRMSEGGNGPLSLIGPDSITIV
jgi:hypothetical protein